MAGVNVIYTCEAGLKGFPIALNKRPTLEQYERSPGANSIDFQWDTSTSNGVNYGGTAVTEPSTTTSIILINNDTTTVIYNEIIYTIKNVQIIKGGHGNWLLTDPGTGNYSYDLVILFQGAVRSRPIYMMFVIPLIKSNDDTSSNYIEHYFNNVPLTQTLEKFFPITEKVNGKNTPILYAGYSTCFDGFVDRAHTQNIDVFVSTTGVKVKGTTLAKIGNAGSIELPSDVINRNGGGGRNSNTPTTILVDTELQSYITNTKFSIQLSSLDADSYKEKLKQPADAYQCIEIDAKNVDENLNILTDMNRGEKTDLKSILQERAFYKSLVTDEGQGISKEEQEKRKNTRVGVMTALAVVVLGIVLFIGAQLWKSSEKNLWNSVKFFTIFLCVILFFSASVIFFTNKENNIQTNVASAGVAGAGFVLSFLYWLSFYVLFPEKEGCNKNNNESSAPTAESPDTQEPPRKYFGFSASFWTTFVTFLLTFLIGFISGNVFV